MDWRREQSCLQSVVTNLTWPAPNPLYPYPVGSAVFNVAGNDTLGSGSAIFGTVNLAAHSHLVTTGNIHFLYGETFSGQGSITNNGSIMTEDTNISVPVSGHGTLGIGGYHDGYGVSAIRASISSGQTVDVSPNVWGMRLTLYDPRDFHALLRIEPGPSYYSDVTVVLKGVQADKMVSQGDHLLLYNGARVVDALHVSNVGHVPVTASYGADTTLTFHTMSAH